MGGRAVAANANQGAFVSEADQAILTAAEERQAVLSARSNLHPFLEDLQWVMSRAMNQALSYEE